MNNANRTRYQPWCVGAAIFLMLAGCTVQQPSGGADSLVSLGSSIFHDATLSADRTLSCAGCHQASKQFTDARATSIGSGGVAGTRNAPALTDIRLMSSFFWDGRVSQLEDVVLQPFTNSVEMGLSDRSELIDRINQQPAYRDAARKIFKSEALTEEQVADALVAFLRSIPVNRTRYDVYVSSKGTRGLDDAEVQGLRIFEGKGGCAGCHKLQGSPATLTDQRFHHTGIGFERAAGNITELLSRIDRERQQGATLGHLILSDPQVAELGRFAHTRRPDDLGAFRTPTLRNAALTAPYMHDGSVSTLEGAIERELYYRGLARGRPITLTVEEQQQLLAFLRALNSEDALESKSPVRRQ